MRILLAEDDNHLRGTVTRGLIEEGYVVDSYARGDAAGDALLVGGYDLAILDWNLPGHTGLEICLELRAQNANLPVLMLTARDGPDDRVAGLDGGADDYLVKPFDFGELLARVRALVRRRVARPGHPLVLGRMTLDQPRKHAIVGEHILDLTPREYAVLERLVLAAEPVVSKADLARSVMSDDIAGVDSHSLYVHVSRIRGKLRQAGAGVSIETVRGAGFRLVELPGPLP